VRSSSLAGSTTGRCMINFGDADTAADDVASIAATASTPIVVVPVPVNDDDASAMIMCTNNTAARSIVVCFPLCCLAVLLL